MEYLATMSISLNLRFIALSVLAPLSAPAAEVGALATWSGTPDQPPFGGPINTASGSTSQSGSGNGFSCRAGASAGALGASAKSTLNYVSGFTPNHNIRARSYWFDQIVISAPGVPTGTIGEARFTPVFTGYAQRVAVTNPSTVSLAEIRYYISATSDAANGLPDPGTGDMVQFLVDPDEAGGVRGFDFTATPVQHVVTFRFGQPTDFTIDVRAEARRSTGENSSVRASIQYKGWDGFESVVIRDTGTPVTNLSVGSTAGFDFAHAGTASFTTWSNIYDFPTGTGGPTADPNNNGLCNLLEYGLGLDPLATGGNGGPVGGVVEISGSRYLSFSYTRPTRGSAPGDLTFAVESSSNLSGVNFSLVPGDVVPYSTTPIGGNRETVIVRSTQPLSALGSAFRRLAVKSVP